MIEWTCNYTRVAMAFPNERKIQIDGLLHESVSSSPAKYALINQCSGLPLSSLRTLSFDQQVVIMDLELTKAHRRDRYS